MKTKTIYHLDQDCNIMKIEVVTKMKKAKKWRKLKYSDYAKKARLEYKMARKIWGRPRPVNVFDLPLPLLHCGCDFYKK